MGNFDTETRLIAIKEQTDKVISMMSDEIALTENRGPQGLLRSARLNMQHALFELNMLTTEEEAIKRPG